MTFKRYGKQEPDPCPIVINPRAKERRSIYEVCQELGQRYQAYFWFIGRKVAKSTDESPTGAGDP